MKRRATARLYAVTIAVLGCWPFAQHVLATRYEVNPWKLFGMAMYCTPHSIQLELWDETAETRRELDPGALSPETRRALAVYRQQREVLGRLCRPDALARRLLAELPATKRLQVRIGVTRLDPESARSSTSWRWYRYASR